MYQQLLAVSLLSLLPSGFARPTHQHGHKHTHPHMSQNLERQTSDNSGSNTGGSKKGLAFNTTTAPLSNLFSGSKSALSWEYNWGSTNTEGCLDLEYVPILHDQNCESDWAGAVKTAVDGGSKYVMSYNEPDQCGGGGACMTDVATTVAHHKQYMDSLKTTYKDLKIGAPAVTNGVKSDQGTPMGVDYLTQFIAQCSDCQIDFVVAHWYGDSCDDFTSHLQQIYTAGGNRSVWVTEFATNQASEAAGFLPDAMKFLDTTPWIERYSYFMVAPDSLVNADGSGLSDLGNTYVGSSSS